MTRKVSSWWVYEGPEDLKALSHLKGVLDSISLNCHPHEIGLTFVSDCKEMGISVLLLANHLVGDYCGVKARSSTIDCLISNVEKFNFDGVDIDYEFQPTESCVSFCKFVTELGHKLKSRGKLLSICVGFYPSLQGREVDHGFINPVEIAANCDQVRVMCYDQNFAPGKGVEELKNRLDCQSLGPTSSQSFTRDALAHWSKFVPKDKLIAGLPAYGNDYIIVPGGSGTQITDGLSLIGSVACERIWMWYEKVNLYRYLDKDGQGHCFFASDEQSTTALIDVVTDLDISTLGFWHGSLVTPAMWDVASRWKLGFN